MFLHLYEEQADFQQHPATFTPQLAKSYEWSPDHKVLTFHLRDDVVWTDGVPVTSADVRWTWQAQRDKDVAWELADSKHWIDDVEAVDPRTVRFHFSRVYAKQLLDANEGPVFPKHAWETLPFAKWRQSGDWFRQHLVVDGPFTIASWQPQQQIVLQRNDKLLREGAPLPRPGGDAPDPEPGERPDPAPERRARLPAADRADRRAARQGLSPAGADRLLVQHLRRRRLEQRGPAFPGSRGAAGADPRHRPQDDRRHPPRALRQGRRLPDPDLGLGSRPGGPSLALRPAEAPGSSPPRGGRTRTATASSTRAASPSPSSCSPTPATSSGRTPR